jgi:RND family efflux transporter MFP subunit
MTKRTLIICAWILMTVCPAARAQEPSVLIRQATVRVQTLRDTLTVYGKVVPDPDAVQTISLLHEGMITRVAVGLGQRVKRDQLLLELATSPTAHMQYVKARSAVDYAQSELDRQLRLLQTQLTTKAKVTAARNALADARTNLKALEAQGQNRARETVLAPVGGIITQLAVKQGERLQAGASVLAIASGRRLVAMLGVEPEDIRLLKPGNPVTIRSVFVSGFEADCKLREVHAMINPATGLVDAVAPIPADQADHLVLGSFLTADIQLNAHTGMTVPRQAVLRDQHGAYVFKVVDGKARRVAVETGLENDRWIEITRGVKPEESVVTLGNYELDDGMPVREGR